MNFSHKIKLLVFVIATGINVTVACPMSLYLRDGSNSIRFQPSDLSEKRFSRQVVQPSWLNFGPEPAVDPTVHVNRKALLEAEKIRKTIQKAVKEDTFAVTADQQYPNDMNIFPVTHTYEEKNTIYSIKNSPNWFTRLQEFWREWTRNMLKGFRA